MKTTVTVSPTRAVFAGSLLHNKLRTALSALAIALGVALGFAVQTINATAVNELAQGIQMLSGDADLELRGPRGGFDETLYPELARMPEVAVASPVVEVEARLVGRDGALRLVGIDVFRAGAINPALIPAVDEPLDVLRPDALFLSASAASWLGVKPGEHVTFQVGLREVSLRVAGSLSGATRARFAVMDIAGAQAGFDRLGRVSRIDLRLVPGTDVDAFAQRVAGALPAGVAAQRPAVTLAAGTNLSRSYRVNLNVLALVALFTGGLLVFSTQALGIVHRRASFALLRVLGMTRRQLITLIVAEGAMIGLAGSIAGVLVGYALADLVVRVVGVDLGSGYLRGVAPAVSFDPASIGVFVVLGVVTAMLGSLAPALEVARAAPARALKAGDEAKAFTALSPAAPGLIALGLALPAALLPPLAGLPLFGYGAIALLLLGTLMLMPRLVSLLLARAPMPTRPAQALALAQLRNAPGPISVSLAAIVASVSLSVAMAIMVSSFRNSLDDWLEHVLLADVYLRAAGSGDTAFLNPDEQARILTLPGVRRAEFVREAYLVLDAGKPRVALVARNIDARNPRRQLPLVDEGNSGPMRFPPVWVSEAMVDLYGFAPGRDITLPLGGSDARFTIAGVWRDYVRQQGAIAIERERYVALTGDTAVTSVALWLAPGTRADELREALLRAIPGGDKLEWSTPGEIRALSLRVFDRTFAVTYALELAALLIGLLALSSSFAALVLARRREFGMLRHLGMTRRQIGAMLATEGCAVSGIGLLIGMSLGGLMSLILIHVVNRQSFHWGMEISVPWILLSAFAVAVLGFSTLTALASGRQAMSVDVVAAVKEDW